MSDRELRAPKMLEAFQGQPRRTGRFWFDFLAASAAVIVSVVSLVVAMHGEDTQRQLLAANSWPFLQAEVYQHAHKLDTVGVSNAGVGPAKIITFEVFYKGQPVKSAVDLLRQCCGLSADDAVARKQLPRGLSMGQIDNNVLRPGELLRAFSLERVPDSAEIFDRLEKAVDTLTFSACYCSILNQCWQSNLQSLNPSPVSACPVPIRPFQISHALD